MYYIYDKIFLGGDSLLVLRFLAVLFFNAIQLLGFVVIGEYLMSVYEESKHWPRHIIEEKINFN